MAILNQDCFISQIQCTIDNEDFANNAASGLLFTAFAVDKLNTNRSSFIDTVNNLPAANTILDGQIIFVDEIKRHVLNSQQEYELLDGTQLCPANVGVVWGGNLAGQLGTGNFNNTFSPVGLTGVNNKWCQVSAGSTHTAAVKTDGTLWTWGANIAGQLGNLTNISKNFPSKISSDLTNWCQVSAGQSHTVAIRRNCSIFVWGSNANGRLGTGNVIDRSIPTAIAGITNWCQVSAGSAHTAAIKTDGTFWTWGRNDAGQLGTGNTADRSFPVTTAGAGTNWCQVSAGNKHTTAIKTDGTLWTWGSNDSGQLGTGDTTNRSSPGTTAGAGTNWCQVSAAYTHTSAVKTDGTLWTWGCNLYGQLGDGSTTNRSSPGTTAGGYTNWAQVSVGVFHTTAVKQDGTLWTWGNNQYGRLGDGTTTARCSPGTTAGGGTSWTRVSSGLLHNIATTNPV